MAPIKRKADSKAKEDAKASDASRPSKRSRNEKSSAAERKNAKSNGAAAEPTTIKSSTLLEDESNRAFPRGGASILTPLEQKQIQVKAAKDALFEESGRKRSKTAAIEGAEADSADEDEDMVVDATEQKKTKKRKTKPVKGKAIADPDQPHFRVEGLKAKNLQPGYTVLGQVARMSAHELVLDLPNNLSGTVSLASISPQLTHRMQELVDEEEDSEKEDTSVSEDIDLRKLFHVGQYVRAAPLRLEGDSAKRKRIDLTIDPRNNNGRLRPDSLPVYSTVQASVVSIEDHGVIMDMGFEDKSVRGFMSSREIPFKFAKADIQPGMVFLCVVTGLSSNGKVVKLSANHQAVGDVRKANVMAESPTIDPLLPGTAIEMLVSRVGSAVLAGQVLGSVNAGADLVHSGAGPVKVNLEGKYKPGDKIKARIIYSVAGDETVKLGVSLLDHVLTLSSKRSPDKSLPDRPTVALQSSSFVEEAKVTAVEPGLGVFVDTGVKGVPGFVHISRLADERVDEIVKDSGKFKVGSSHRGRVLGYNGLDGLYLLSFQESVIKQPFLRLEDISVGQKVNANVEKLVISAAGSGGVVLELSEGITGFVPETHLADVHLAHPERKFKPGVKVRARVLSIDVDRRQMHLTLKKSLIEDETPIWTSYQEITAKASATGTISRFTPQGAVVHFFNKVRGFLPKHQMSDSFIEDPTKHFRIGQSVRVHALDVAPEESRLIVSCRSSASAEAPGQDAFQAIKLGDKVAGTITEKSSDDVTIDLNESEQRVILRIGQLTDGNDTKNASAFKRLRIGQILENLVVIEKIDKKLAVAVSSKPSFFKSSDHDRGLDDLEIGQEITCYVKNITATAVFVAIVGGYTGLLPKGYIPDDTSSLPNFGLSKDQILYARILSIDLEEQRFAVTMKPNADVAPTQKKPVNGAARSSQLVKPVDGKTESMDDFVPGYMTKARITSIKDTQLNVQLADRVQGRIDVSELFDSIEDIKDRKHPLRSLKVKQELDVRVLGLHDARNHRFLPISHRAGKVPVFELSAKKGQGVLNALDEVQAGESYLGFVNNISDSCLWINISPNVRGRVQLMDVSDNPSVLQDLDTSFPVGSAAKVTVKSIDVANGRLDLTIKPAASSKLSSLDDLSVGTSVAGRVTKVTERAVFVQLSATISGQIGLTELADDYDEATTARYGKNEVVRVCIVDIDKSNKRVTLSTRPSKIASSSLPVQDKLIVSASQIKVNDIVRGFVKNVADVGLFIALGPKITAFVRVAELSDGYMKDWKAQFSVDKLVEGKVIAVDHASGHIQMSLKKSVLSDDYTPPTTFDDMRNGQIVTGKVRKVEDYGAFIVVDNSHNVSGLCHRSEVADHKITDVRKVLSEGDPVKAVVLEVSAEKRRISFGLKASYFENLSSSGEDSDEDVPDVEDGGVDLEDAMNDEDEELSDAADDNGDDDSADEDLNDLHAKSKSLASKRTLPTSNDMDDDDDDDGDDDEGLGAVGFDWTGASLFKTATAAINDSTVEPAKKKKKHRTEIVTDETGDLDRFGPRSSSDFERLLLGQRNSSSLWVQYMAFQLNLGEIDLARQIAERALREINIREQEEKMNVWVALLNLENAYGTEDSIEDTFKRACEVSDGYEMHERLVSIYIDSGKIEKAHRLLLAMSSNKRFTPAPKLWTNFATFLFDTLDPPSPQTARDMLPRAMQSVPSHLHRELITQFALLEFKRRNGDAERGRTMFAQLLDTYPKRWDLWDVYLDTEKAQGAVDNVRRIYEDMTSAKRKVRPKRAQAVFKAWLAYEEEHGNKKQCEHVKARAAEWVERHKQAQEEAAAAEEDAD